MRFLRRALVGSLLTAVTAGLLGLGAWRIHAALDGAGARSAAPAQERFYTVDAGLLRPETVTPVISAYGELRAWRKLEIRAPVAGPLTALAPEFRDGAAIGEGLHLFTVDPTDYRRRLRDAEIALDRAGADLRSAREEIRIAASETRIAGTQLAIRKGNLARKKALRGKGHVADAAYDDARSAVAAAEQTLAARRKAELAARVAIDRAEHARERAEIAREDAAKALAETRFHAPFDGALTGVVATLGRRVAKNEVLGTLIDPRSLEVSFRVDDAAFGRLLAPGRGGAVVSRPVKARLSLGEREIELAGRLDRAAAVTDLARGGRTLYARIETDPAAVARAGDFVTVEVEEAPIENAARIPARAATDDGRVFLIGDGNRLEEARGRILRRQGDWLIVAGLPFGRRYVTARLAHLAAGFRVEVNETAPGGVPVAERRGGPDRRTRPASTAGGGLVEVDEARRARLTAFIKANDRMPGFVRMRLLTALEKPLVPRRLIERLESRIAGEGG